MPADLTETVSRMVQNTHGKEMSAQQSRDYAIYCENGDEVYIKERTNIRIWETNE
jgi:hypothetical protein